MKLTKARVESLKPEEKRRYVYDDELPGFGVVIQPTGKKAFFIQYRTPGGRNGASKRLILGSFPVMTVEQARAEAKVKLADAVRGDDPTLARRQEKEALTVQTALEEFMDLHVEAKRKPSTIRNYEMQARLYVLPSWGSMKVKDITPTHVVKLHHGLREIPYQGNRTLAMLSKFFGWCEQVGHRERGTNPVVGVERFREHKRTRFMDEETIGKIGSSLAVMESQKLIDPYAAAAIRTLFFTGARLNEILTLQWADVELENGKAHLKDSKTGAKVLRLGAPAVALLEALPRINEWCFPSSKTEGHLVNLRKRWVVVCEHAGITGWRIHDLRHAFASMAADAGNSLPVVGAILGHTQAQTTARYAHLSDNPVAKAADETARAVERALNSGKVVALKQSSN